MSILASIACWESTNRGNAAVGPHQTKLQEWTGPIDPWLHVAWGDRIWWAGLASHKVSNPTKIRHFPFSGLVKLQQILHLDAHDMHSRMFPAAICRIQCCSSPAMCTNSKGWPNLFTQSFEVPDSRKGSLERQGFTARWILTILQN